MDEASNNPETTPEPSSSGETVLAEQEPAQGNESAVNAKTPEFAQLNDESTDRNDGSLNRFYDVEVTISAELGRITMPIGDVVKLGEGSVIDLDRAITSPIDVVAQGVRIATGEVVVIDDCFAVRIKQIDSVEHKE